MADARHARSGVCESGTAVSGLVPYTLRATIGGTARRLILEDFTLDDSLDGAPARVTARVHGWTPTVGQALRLADDGATRYLFAGTILRRRASNQPGLPVIWNLEAVDYQFLLNAHDLVFEDFEEVAVNTAVARILARYTDAAAGFRIGGIHAALGRITQRFDGARVTDAIERIATAAGAFWRVTPDKRLDVFTDLPSGNDPQVLSDQTAAEGLDYEEGIQQTRTRVIAEGGGSQTTALVARGAATIPVDDITGYVVGTVSAPNVRVQGMLVSYTGTDALAGPGSLTGCTGIVRDIPQGARVAYANQYDDVAAQGAMATRLGGGLSGVLVHRETSQTIQSVAEAEDIAAADLGVFKRPLEGLTYRIVNPHYRPGLTVTASVTAPFAITGTFRIQQVRSVFRGDPARRAGVGTTAYELTKSVTLRPIPRRRLGSLLRES